MTQPPELFDITVWLEVERDPATAAESLVRTLSGDEATAARAGTVRRTDHGVAVGFPEVTARMPPSGAEYTPPRPDEPTEAPGRVALESMQEMTDILPVVRALIALSAARVRSGLAPSQRIVIGVRPSPVHSQDELRHA